MSEYTSPEQNRLYVAKHRAKRIARGEREVRTWLDAETLAEVDRIARDTGESRGAVLAALIKTTIGEKQ